VGAAGERARRGVFARLADWIPRRARRLWIGSTLALVLLGLGLTGLDTTLTQQQQFTEDVEAVRGQELLASGFPAGASAPASVLVPPDADVDAVRGALEDAPQVASVGAAREGPPGTLLTVVLDGDPYAPATVDRIADLRTAVDDAAGDALVGGPTAQEYDLRAAANRDNLVVPPVALAVVLLILIALLRSVAAPVLLLATVVLSNAAALGLGVLLSEHVYGFAAIDPTLPLLGFIFLAALGIDYNIFLAARAREESERHGPRKGMLLALTVTGAVITAAGVVLAATFATLAVLPLVVLAQLGTVVALGVLIDTLLVRSVLVPALAYDLDGRFWWPARFMGR
jgi:RND superfamily putative drug exporter